ncbi:MAG TPA: hypothetical protein VKC63_06100 [Solirubrobacterales bacterium]|nr:hypothetical protein [Solirubrobacterales bacterium]
MRRARLSDREDSGNESDGGGKSAAQRLIETYVPRLMLREQQDPPCETSAEQYQPTAADVAGLGDEYHLDIPGDPLDDTCVYARDFAQLKREGEAPGDHLRPHRPPGRAPRAGSPVLVLLVLQSVQRRARGRLGGNADRLRRAEPACGAAGRPERDGPLPAAGGETASWEDAKVEKEGTHPVVYPAAGSHATFYDSTVYVENGQGGSGVGCDNTSEPLRRLAVRPVGVPTFPTTTGRFKWLTYFGHWGEKEKGFNNGPTGPVTKPQWLEPFSWMDGQRSTSPRLPGGSIVGPAVTGAFCGAVAEVSNLINLDAKSRPAAIETIAAALILLALLVGLTRWRPVNLSELRHRRAFGQLVRAPSWPQS